MEIASIIPEAIFRSFTPQIDSVFQVGISRKSPSVSPLSLRERVRVRGF
jgi:hypothetical protein